MVPIRYFMFFMPAFASTSFATRSTISFCSMPARAGTQIQRNHDFGDHFYALLGHLHSSFEDGARLHLGDFGMYDSEPAPAEAEHRIEFVPDLPRASATREASSSNRPPGCRSFPRHLLLLFTFGVREQRQIHHQVFPLGKELMQGRIQRADDHRISVHELRTTRRNLCAA